LGIPPAPIYNYLYEPGSSTYTAAAGSSLTVNIYLGEGSTDGSSLINGDGGLYAGAFTASPFGASTPASTIVSVAGNPGMGGLANPTGFDSSVTASTSGGVGTVSESSNAADVIDLLSAPVVGSGFSGVLLGTATINVGPVGTTSTFEVGPADGSFTNDSVYDLDDNTGNESLYTSAAPTTFSVTATSAVPEPTSGAMIMIVLASALRRGRSAHRRKTS
jgi:hypothetical protein